MFVPRPVHLSRRRSAGWFIRSCGFVVAPISRSFVALVLWLGKLLSRQAERRLARKEVRDCYCNCSRRKKQLQPKEITHTQAQRRDFLLISYLSSWRFISRRHRANWPAASMWRLAVAKGLMSAPGEPGIEQQRKGRRLANVVGPFESASAYHFASLSVAQVTRAARRATETSRGFADFDRS